MSYKWVQSFRAFAYDHQRKSSVDVAFEFGRLTPYPIEWFAETDRHGKSYSRVEAANTQARFCPIHLVQTCLAVAEAVAVTVAVAVLAASACWGPCVEALAEAFAETHC